MFFFISRTPLATAFVAAGEEMGYQNRDGNGEFQTGFMIPQVSPCDFRYPYGYPHVRVGIRMCH
jgi:hypothetical protein